MDLDSILEGNPASPSEKAEADKATRVRDESGRFAKGEEEKPEVEAKEPERAPEPEPVAAPPAAQEAQPTDPQASAFYAKAKDETAKRQRLEKELEQERQRAQEYARRVAEYEARNAPDPLIDPEGRLRYERQQAQQAAWNDKLSISEQYARMHLGDEVVSEAQQAFISAVQQQPYLYAQLQRETDPYGFVVKWHKREKLLTEIGDDPEAYRQRLLTTPPGQAQIQAPPRSLASATGARVSEPALSAEHKPLKSIFGR